MRRMKDRDFDSAISIVRYVRVRKGLSQQGLCNACSDGLHPNDISKLERRDFRLQLWKVNAVAQFIGVSLDALVENDFRALRAVPFPAQADRNKRLREKRMNKFLQRDDIGKAGEALVLQTERDLLSGSEWETLVDGSYADSETAGFDLMSFRNERPLFIEVKASIDNERHFYLSENERLFAEYCWRNDRQYCLVRVNNVLDDQRRSCTVYSAQELLQLDRRVISYVIRERN